MADQLSSTTSSTNLLTSTLPTPLSNTLTTVTSKLESTFSKILPPSTRENLKSKLQTFLTTHPYISSFLLSQLAISGLPLILFAIVCLTILIFALLAGILVGVLGALVFIVFMVGVALVVLLPTLFATTFFATAVWLFGTAGWYFFKWFVREGDGSKGEGVAGQSGLGVGMGLDKNGITDKLNGGVNGSGDVSGGGGGAAEPETSQTPTTTTTTTTTTDVQREKQQHDGGGDGEKNMASHARPNSSHKSQHRSKKSRESGEKKENKISSVQDVGGVATADGLADTGKNVTGLVT